MPCRDYYEDSQNEALEYATKVINLQERNDVLMRCLCKLDKFCLDNNGKFYDVFLLSNKELREVLQQHRKSDEDNWFEVYSKKYPNFSKEEIARMVRAGILQDI